MSNHAPSNILVAASIATFVSIGACLAFALVVLIGS